jgi:hypothetical protein
MPQCPFKTISQDKTITQSVGAIDAHNLRVEHWIQLEPHQDAALIDRKVFDKSIDDKAFASACLKYDIEPRNATILIEYIYMFLDDYVDRPFSLSKTFPEDRDYYYLPGKPQVVAAATGTSSTSRTAGEAL